jgi:hypothetical protein
LSERSYLFRKAVKRAPLIPTGNRSYSVYLAQSPLFNSRSSHHSTTSLNHNVRTYKIDHTSHCTNTNMDDTKPPKAKGFFSLPSEVRNQIYALLFEYDEPLHIVLDDESGRIGLHRRESGGADGDDEVNGGQDGENNEQNEENGDAGDAGDEGESNDSEKISNQADENNECESHENNDQSNEGSSNDSKKISDQAEEKGDGRF